MASKNTPSSRAEQKAAAQSRRTARQDKTARAAEVLREQQKARKRQERMIVIGVVAVIALIVGLVAWALWNSNNNSDKTDDAPANVTDTYALSVGSDEAERTVTIYEDFLCPACGVLEQAATPILDQAVEDGTARVEYRPVSILGPDYSMESANAFAVVLDTAGPEVAKEFHDTLYAEQPGEGGNLPGDDWLIEKAVEAGADEDAIRSGIEDVKFERWVEKATDEFSKAGHTGTPTVLVDGEVVAGQTMQEIVANLQAALQQ